MIKWIQVDKFLLRHNHKKAPAILGFREMEVLEVVEEAEEEGDIKEVVEEEADKALGEERLGEEVEETEEAVNFKEVINGNTLKATVVHLRKSANSSYKVPVITEKTVNFYTLLTAKMDKHSALHFKAKVKLTILSSKDKTHRTVRAFRSKKGSVEMDLSARTNHIATLITLLMKWEALDLNRLQE